MKLDRMASAEFDTLVSKLVDYSAANEHVKNNMMYKLLRNTTISTQLHLGIMRAHNTNKPGLLESNQLASDNTR